jgi:hypothetical protein
MLMLFCDRKGRFSRAKVLNFSISCTNTYKLLDAMGVIHHCAAWQH